MLHRLLLSKHLEDDETLIRAVHKHWLVGFGSLFWPTLMLALGWSVLFFLGTARPLLVSVGVWSLLCGIWWLRNFFDYYLDAWLITDQGIVDIAWHGWFHRQSTRVLFSDLQGVSYEIYGILGTLLRYGTISMEKISTGSSMSLEHVGSPKQVEILILRTMEEYLHKKNLKDSKQIQQLLSSILAEQIQLQDFDSDDDDE